MQTGNIAFGFNLGADAQVVIAAYGVAEGSGANVGRTVGGVEFSIDREMKEVETDQDPGPIAVKEVKRKGKLKFKLAEITLANLAVALNLPTTAVAGSTLSLGAPSNGELYRTIYLNVDGVTGGTRKYTFHKCVISGPGSHSFKKDGMTEVELEAEVLWDTAQSAGEEMGLIVDSSTDSTPPTVALSTPIDGGTVTKDAKGVVVWTITETNALDESTIAYGATFILLNTTAPTVPVLVAGTIVYSPTAKTVTFTPTANWTASDSVKAIVTTGLKDINGNALAAAKCEDFAVTA